VDVSFLSHVEEPIKHQSGASLYLFVRPSACLSVVNVAVAVYTMYAYCYCSGEYPARGQHMFGPTARVSAVQFCAVFDGNIGCENLFDVLYRVCVVYVL